MKSIVQLFGKLRLVLALKVLLLPLFFSTGHPAVAQSQELTSFEFVSPLSSDFSRFGNHVAIEGNYAVISSSVNGKLTRFYHFNGTSWNRMQDDIIHNDTPSSIAIHEGRLIIGFRTGGFQSRGSANIYRLDNAGTNSHEWVFDQEITSDQSKNDGDFGYSVDIRHNLVAVGEINGAGEDDFFNPSGSVHIFEFDGTEWNWKQKFYSPDEIAGTKLGWSLSFNEDGTELIATSLVETNNIYNAYHYFRQSNGIWAQGSTLKFSYTSPTIADNNKMGVAFHKDLIAIGTPQLPRGSTARVGAVQLYTREGSGWSASQVFRKEGANNQGDSFGVQVELFDGIMAVSAPGQRIGGSSGVGSVFIYEGSGTSWSEIARIDSPSPQSESFFGNSISFDESGRLISGVPEFRVNGNRIGRAHIHFVLPTDPANFRVSDGTQLTTINLSWDRAAGQDGYRIYERGNSTAVEIIESGTANSTSFSGLIPGEVREYGISSYNAIRESEVVWDIGYTRPNGRISGTITSQGGSGMPGALVTAVTADTQREIATFTGDGFFEIPHTDALNTGDDFTFEAIIRAETDQNERYAIYSTRSENRAGSFQIEIGPGAFNLGTGTIAVSSVNKWVVQSASGVITPFKNHHVVYQKTGNLHRIYVDGELVAENTDDISFQNNSSPKLIGAGTNYGQEFVGRIGEVRLWNTIRTQQELDDFRAVRLPGSEPGLAAYWRLEGELETGAVDWAGESNGFSNNVSFDPFGSSSNPDFKLPEWGAYTREDGTYDINGMIYGAGTDYIIAPSFGNNEYDPENRERRLAQDQPVNSNVDFTDITTFTVSGQIQFEGTSCFAADVDIYVNDLLAGSTEPDGTFSVAILQSGENTIRPVFGDHTFEPAEIELDVLSDIGGINFSNTQRRTVSGQVAGGDCRFFIGEGNLTATGENQCFTETATTDNSGNYSIDLPALPNLILETDIPANDDVIFQAREISLSDTSTAEDFIYRTAPIISLSGLPEPTSCGTRVLRQLDSYFVEIEAFEEYEAGTCAVDNGTVVINNQIADRSEPDTLQIVNGIAVYDFMAGNPNIVGGGNRPYQKLLSMEVQTGDEELDTQYSFNEVFDEWAIVEGHRPREKTFTTVSPEIPFFILRDPPGDQSYSFLSEEQSVCRTMSMSLLEGIGSTVWAEAKLGTKFEAGLGVSTETEVWASINTSLSISATLISQEEVETCLITNQEFTTSDSNAFIGEDGDLYVGAAMNILYAITDVLEYNRAACRVDLSKDIVFGNDGFETEYIYTESHIRDVVIPDLERIMAIPSVSADSVAFLANQVDVWKQTLEINSEIKEETRDQEPLNNYSFSGGTGRAYSVTSTVSEARSIEYDIEIDSEVAIEAGLEIAGSGVSGGASIRLQNGLGESQTIASSQSNTIGFFLGDDDAGDSYSVNVMSDPVFGTFVFDLEAGVSSCPWEKGTLPRDGVQLTADQLTQVDVPADQDASFRLTLGNTGQNNETRQYRLNAIPGTNPDGAVILINGIPISTLEPYLIPDLGSLDQTLTIGRGATAFDYENLGIVLRSTCDSAVSDTLSLTVRFESSCSPMTLENIDDGWIVNAGAGNQKPFTVSGYDKSAFNNILLQSSPAGQNSWETSQLISVNDLPNNSADLTWDVSNLDDGEYDFRVAVQCDAGVSYTSQVSGTISRGGLLVEGLPQPSDKNLNIGKVISITFNRPLNPSSVTAGSVRLTDLSTGERIASTGTVSGNTIVITPEVDIPSIQNRLLQASVAGIADENDNQLPNPVSWQFRVRQNPVSWDQVVLRETILLGDQTTLTATLSNQGAVEESFNFISYPDWLNPGVLSGTLQPGEEQVVAFSPDPLLGAGFYRDTVVTETSLGNETLVVEYGIQCEPPAWELDENAFAYSMNLIASFYVGEVPFSSENDIVAAFVGDELRGVSRVVPIVPGNEDQNDYEYTGFVTIYSDNPSGETATFQLWDAAACRVMDVTDSVEFMSDSVIGSADSPEKFSITGAMLQTIPVVQGNNWFSLGVEATNMTVNNVLSRTRPQDGDAVIGQAGYNQFVLGSGWVGTIDSLDPGIMYKLKLSNDSNVDLIGQQVDGDDRPISVNEGWNWIGYLPDEPRPLDDALASLSHSNGDRIRSQTAFSEFSGENNLWVGNLSSMSPGTGYKLFRNESGTLTYPGAIDVNNIEIQNMSIAEEPGWEVNAADYEQVMAVTGRLTLSGDVITGDSAWLSAWINGELRGVTRAVNVLDQWLYFMNVNGESDDDESMIEFKAWHPEMGLYEDLSGMVSFNAEGLAGSPREPIELFGDVATSTEEIANGLPVSFELNQNYPNPFNPTTQIDFALPEASDVRLEIFNVIGQRVSVLVNEQRTAGYHNVRFDASGLASGVYFYRIQAGSFVKTQKMMLVK